MNISDAVRLLANADPERLREVAIYADAMNPGVMDRVRANLRLLADDSRAEKSGHTAIVGHLGAEEEQ